MNGPALAELDRSKEAQETVEALKGMPASIWLTVNNIYIDDAMAATNDTRFSRKVFTYLSERGHASVTIHDRNVIDVNMVHPLSSLVDSTFAAYTTQDDNNGWGGSHTYIYFQLGTFESVAVLNVEKVTDDANCEWMVTYRGWIADPTSISLAISAVTGIDGVVDGFKFSQCYRVGKSGLESYYQNFLNK